eukprot:5404444-Amphidinium_carterae.1
MLDKRSSGRTRSCCFQVFAQRQGTACLRGQQLESSATSASWSALAQPGAGIVLTATSTSVPLAWQPLAP